MSIEFLITSIVVILLPGTGVIYTIAVGLGQGFKAGTVAVRLPIDSRVGQAFWENRHTTTGHRLQHRHALELVQGGGHYHIGTAQQGQVICPLLQITKLHQAMLEFTLDVSEYRGRTAKLLRLLLHERSHDLTVATSFFPLCLMTEFTRSLLRASVPEARAVPVLLQQWHDLVLDLSASEP